MSGRAQSLVFSIGLAAAMLALCLRLMVPVGWMPVASGNGVVFTLCSGDGDHRISVGKEGRAPDAGGEAGHCAFAGMGTPALPDVPASVLVQLFALFIAMGFAARQRLVIPANKRLRPPLRGPPLRG